MSRIPAELEDFFENAEFPLHIVGKDGIILRANLAELELLGYPREEYLGRHIADFHADREVIDDILARLAREEKLKCYPARLRRKDGSFRHVQITSSGRFHDGAFLNTRCLTVDVTDTRLAEERYWRGVIDALPAAIYMTDAKGLITYYNESAVELAGRRPELGSDSWCVTWRLFNVDGTPLPHDECPMAVALKENRAVRGVEAVAERPDGSRVRFEPYPTPLHDSDGTLIGAVNLLIDVTEQRRLETDAARLAAIVVSSTDAIVSKTLDGIVTSWNETAERLFGYSSSEMIGQSILRIIPAELHGEERDILAKLRRGERIEHFETVRQAKDGRPIDISLSVSPVRAKSGKLIGAAKVARDMSKRRQAEETQKLLLGELNHRVKNTLATVQSIASQTLQRATNPSDFVASFTGRVQALSNAHTLLTGTSWQGAELGALVRSQVLADGISERIACSGPEIMLPSALALHLGLVLHELGTNARKHGALSTPRGQVSFVWSVETGSTPTLHLAWNETGGPPLYVDNRPKRGFGTVLIEHSINAIEGGEAHMHLESHGISWTLTIPVPQASPYAFRTTASQDRPLRGQHPDRNEIAEKAVRVLVVEDEPLIGLDMASTLDAAGFHVIGPIALLDQAMRVAATVEVGAALLDANLGGKPVDELAAMLTRRNIPFAFVTGYGRDSLPKAFASAPMLAKPFTNAMLVSITASMFSRDAQDLRADYRG